MIETKKKKTKFHSFVNINRLPNCVFVCVCFLYWNCSVLSVNLWSSLMQLYSTTEFKRIFLIDWIKLAIQQQYFWFKYHQNHLEFFVFCVLSIQSWWWCSFCCCYCFQYYLHFSNMFWVNEQKTTCVQKCSSQN